MNDILLMYIIITAVFYVLGAIIFFIKLHIAHAETSKYKIHFRHFPTPKLLINNQGVIENATYSAVILFGCESIEHMIDSNIYNFLGSDCKTLLDLDDDSFREHNFDYTFEILGHKKTFNIKLYKTIEKNFIIILTDLTHIDESKHKIDMLLSAIQASHDGIALINAEGLLVSANPALWAIYDISADQQDQILNHHWTNLYSAKGQSVIHNEILPFVKKNKSWSGAAWVKSISGRKFYADLSFVQYGLGFFGVVRDRTDFMNERASHESAQKKLQLAHRNNSIARIIRGMVHDFNNTLSVIMGHSELLVESPLIKDDERVSLTSILKAADKSRAMLSEIRSLIPRDHSYQTPSKAIDIVSCAKDVMSEYRVVSQHFALLSAEAKIDSSRLQDVCRHLMRNAVEATNGDRQKVAISLHALEPPIFSVPYDQFKQTALSDTCHELLCGQIDKDKNYVTLSVHDAGSGIDPDILQHLCEPFFTTKGKNHMGVGLSLLLSFITESKSAFRILSRYHEGTEISVYIPTLPSSLIWPDRSRLPGMNFMVVDPDAASRKLLHTMLRSQGHDVFEFECPLVALDAVREARENFDIILAARTMKPIMGSDFAEEVLIDFADLPIVMIDEMGQCLAVKELDNIKAALNKPINLAILNCEIEKIMSA